MQVSIATAAAHPGAENEDYAAADPATLVLIDGAGSVGAESGCTHGVAWYARQLGTALLAHASQPGTTLKDAFRAAIVDVSHRHGGQCDLSHPGTPSATVLLVRRRRDTLEYLVLADSVLLIEYTNGEVLAISDDREANVGARYRSAMDGASPGPEHECALRGYITAMREHRNRPDGFWVASVDPAAANQALTAELPVSDVRALALLSDGASRVADRFGLIDWAGVVRTLTDYGPAELIRLNRTAECDDPDGARWPRGKIHDDATAAYVSF